MIWVIQRDHLSFTVESPFLEPFIFWTSDNSNPKVVPSSQSNTVILPPISWTTNSSNQFLFPLEGWKIGIPWNVKLKIIVIATLS